ncbi:sulfatase-like hydrolase/transferase [Stieleria sp. TO1_6]|uniref:sulfatase-like hydrolase/transferase n=1 Tax=Stieleria tagensis TaxID=2956795 RepID=UPI00209AFA96|nr:sulfatase-like hydrolase/transferase [Stieleria tagensis]MCO8124929.1 sulfatase-like hydrolase/transferase [Stieleria tagensis]
MSHPALTSCLMIAAMLHGSVVANDDPVPMSERPNIILVMADDQGWGETGYNGHPILKTPNLDAMSKAGLRFNRFYAGAPVCSPTRAAVLTGRCCYRTGVPEHGYALRHQEISLPALLSQAGYQTAHFGKWHLNGLRGPGVPIFDHDKFNPGTFGFDHWLSVTNFYDRDPLLSRGGTIEDFRGDSSDVIVDQALAHIKQQSQSDRPFFDVIWYGTPHSPFKASEADNAAFRNLDQTSMHHYGELVALDRSVGALRAGLRDLKLDSKTLVWYCSDNGGLPKITPGTTGPLRGNKGLIYEGGLRVPGILEWPGHIAPRQTEFPASVMDILPTVLELAEVEYPDAERPRDGISLTHLFPSDSAANPPRDQPICFRYKTKAAIVDGDWKLLSNQYQQGGFELYHLVDDVGEANDVAQAHPAIAQSMKTALQSWYQSTDASQSGADYPSGRVNADHPEPMFWVDRADYQPYLDQWKNRWEYQSWIKRREK